jgi:hypothetical protein
LQTAPLFFKLLLRTEICHLDRSRALFARRSGETSSFGRLFAFAYFSSNPAKKYPISNAAVSSASEP